MEKRMKDMINETLKSGGGIEETKGHGQELIEALVSVKCHLGDVFLFHTYLVVSRTKVKFGKVLRPTEFIQKVIYEGNGEFVLDGKFVEGKKNRTHAPSAFLLEDHENRRRIGVGTGKDNTYF
jgi:hypothetical protein